MMWHDGQIEGKYEYDFYGPELILAVFAHIAILV